MAYHIPLKACTPEEAARRRALRAASMRRWRAKGRESLRLVTSGEAAREFARLLALAITAKGPSE
jgi:hypothetical protein